MADEEPIEIDIDRLKKRRFVITGGSLVAAGAIFWYGHGWVAGHLNVHLIPRAEAQVMSEQIKGATDAAKQAAQAAEGVGRTLVDYIKLQDIKDARERLNGLKGALSETQLWEAANGANDISRARKAELVEQIDVITNYIACVEAGRPNCVQ